MTVIPLPQKADASASIPLERRQSASQALIELADSMMRGASSLMWKSGRVLDPDPKAQRRVIGSLRVYETKGMPCGDQMVRIVALLTGTPEEQCLSDKQERQRRREERQREHDELWDRIRQSPNAREEWERTFAPGARRARKKRRHVDDNVVTGPWQEGA